MVQALLGKKEGLTNYEFIVQRAITYFGMGKKMKDESLEKVMGDENISVMRDFEASLDFLWISRSSAELFTMTSMPPDPKTVRQKALLVIKARRETNDDDAEQGNFFPGGIENEVIFQEITGKLLQNLYSSCQEIFLPILSNPLNQIGWSDLVTKDLMEKFHQFLANTEVTMGLVEGKTNLPLPPSDVTQSEKTSSKDKAAVLENAISHWTRQIKAELRKDPEMALKKAIHPGPLTELEFWQNKSENLNSICEQLSGERIKKVLKFLEQNKSTQTSSFSKLTKEVHIARIEADENFKFLQTLKDYFFKLGDTSLDLPDVAEYFVPIMHTILLIWTYSQHYNTPARLLVLIREICNAIIHQCRQQVDSDKIFGSIKNDDPFEPHTKLTMCLEFCAKFKEVYYDHKAQANNQWKITPSALFVRLDAFIERCQDIMQLTQTIQ
jgi:dynein heavy chain